MLERTRSWATWMGPWRLVGGALGLAVAAAGGWWLVRSPPPPVESTIPFAVTSTVVSVAPVSTAPVAVAVHVAGAVVRPGVYQVPPDARVVDAVRAAGGATAKADLDAVNLARGVTDGEQVYIPRRGRPSGGAPGSAPGRGGSPATPPPTGPVNLNTATVAQLDALPGVGPSIAAAIVEYRGRTGGFASVEDLEKVPGIGPSKMEAIRPLVTV